MQIISKTKKQNTNINIIFFLSIIALFNVTNSIAKDDNLHLRNVVFNSTLNITLADYDGWIYIKKKNSSSWKKLIPFIPKQPFLCF